VTGRDGHGRTGHLTLAALAAALVLSGCDAAGVAFRTAPPDPPATAASAVPPARPDLAPDPVPDGRDPALVTYYARVEADLRARGLLRTDVAPADAPFDAAALAETFERVTFFAEAASRGGRLVRQPTPFPLQRWQDPVRIALYAGPGVPPDQARRDRGSLVLLANRLRRASGHPVAAVAEGANLHVFLVTETERRALGPALTGIAPGISPAIVQAVTDLARSEYCAVFAVEGPRPNVYRTAVAVVRAELPDLLRLSCLHEEIAQAMGLANDWPRARPSIFNDDEEFALLTRHDELLLRILYDPRLSPGMTADEARPIVLRITAE
jgi:hypothetical protein